MRLREALSGKRILLTGVTGFLGEALLERLLSDLADTHLVLLVRGQSTRGASERVRELLTRPAFGALRADNDDDAIAALFDNRITVVDGSLEEVPQLPGDLDLVIHCAGDVSFDPPIDTAMNTNLLGTVRLLEAVHAAGGDPHFIYVSTAYVGGLRRGPVPEERLSLTADWRAEVEAAPCAAARSGGSPPPPPPTGVLGSRGPPGFGAMSKRPRGCRISCASCATRRRPSTAGPVRPPSRRMSRYAGATGSSASLLT